MQLPKIMLLNDDVKKRLLKLDRPAEHPEWEEDDDDEEEIMSGSVPDAVQKGSLRALASHVIEQAALASLHRWTDKTVGARVSGWVYQAQRCITVATALESECQDVEASAVHGEDDATQVGTTSDLHKLKQIKELAAQVVEVHQVGHAVVREIVSGAKQLDEMPVMLKTLHELVQTDSVKAAGAAGLAAYTFGQEAAVMAIVDYKFEWYRRTLQKRPNAVHGQCGQMLAQDLRAAVLRDRERCAREREQAAGAHAEEDGTGEGGDGDEGEGSGSMNDLSPVIGRVIRQALLALRVVDNEQRYSMTAPSFGTLEDVLTEAVNDAEGSWPASLTCAVLQLHFVSEIKERLDQGEDGVISDDDECVAVCADFRTCVATLADDMASATMLYHLAFAKALLQIAAPRLLAAKPTWNDDKLAAALKEALGGEHANSAPRRDLHVYLLKEMRRWSPIEQVVAEARNGNLGRQLGSLKTLADSVEPFPFGGLLGYDPYMLHTGDDYEDARDAWVEALGGSSSAVAAFPLRLNLFACASVIYLPRVRKPADTDKAVGLLSSFVCAEVDEGPDQEESEDGGFFANARKSLSKLSARILGPELTGHDKLLEPLARRLASNFKDASKECGIPKDLSSSLAIRENSKHHHVYLSSLLVNLAGTMDPDYAKHCPLAAMMHLDATSLRFGFLPAAASDPLAGIVKALGGAVTRYKCERPLKDTGAPCGYVYLVGECGNTVGEGKCPQCGSTIGNAGSQYNNVAFGQTRIDAGGHALKDTAPEEPGYHALSPEELEDMLYTVTRGQESSPVSASAFRMIHLLVHLSLLCRGLLGHNQAAELGELFRGIDLAAADGAAHCWQAALGDFEALCRLLDLGGEDLCAWCHSIIEALPRWCKKEVAAELAEESGVLTTARQRNGWESAFSAEFVEPALPRMQQVVRSIISGTAKPSCLSEHMHCGMRGEEPRPVLLRQLEEDSALSVEQRGWLPNVMCVVMRPSFSGLQAAFSCDARNAEDYPFLSLVLGSTTQLEQAEWLWAMLEWERLFRSTWGGELSREQAEKTPIKELLRRVEKDEALHRKVSKAFASFAYAWDRTVRELRVPTSELYQRYQRFGGCKAEEIVKTMCLPMDEKVMAIYCCVDSDNSDRVGRILRLLIQTLVQTHNEFLDRVMPLVPMTQSLKAMSLGGDAIEELIATPVGKVRKQQMLVTLESEWDREQQAYDFVSTIGQLREEEEWHKYGLSYTGYSAGEGARYNYSVIEYELSQNLIVGTTRVGTEGWTDFAFPEELHQQHTDLLAKLDRSIKQVELQNKMGLQGSPFLSETKDGVGALTLLETVIYSCTKTAAAADLSLATYCHTFRLAKADHPMLMDELIKGVKLNQLRALYEAIEEKIADDLIDQIPERYKRSLDDAQKKVDDICVTLGERLYRTVVAAPTSNADEEGHAAAARTRATTDGTSRYQAAGCDLLEPCLKRFIVRFLVKENCPHEPQWHLRDFAESIPWPSEVKLQGQTIAVDIDDELLAEAFDEEVSLGHAHAVWAELKTRKAARAPVSQAAKRGNAGGQAAKRKAGGKKRGLLGET